MNSLLETKPIPQIYNNHTAGSLKNEYVENEEGIENTDVNDCYKYFIGNHIIDLNPRNQKSNIVLHKVDFINNIHNNDCNYWQTEKNNFWPSFLLDNKFDHYWFVNILKTILGEEINRKIIISHFNSITNSPYLDIKTPSRISNSTINSLDGKTTHGSVSDTSTEYDNNLNRTHPMIIICSCATVADVNKKWKLAQSKRCIAYITWIYPPNANEHHDIITNNIEYHEETHYAMIIANPNNLTVEYVDSRGLVEGPPTRLSHQNKHDKNDEFFSVEWKSVFKALKKVFVKCRWINLFNYDIQAMSQNDDFCQTWSLLLTVNHMHGNNIWNIMTADPLDIIISFFKECISITDIKEAVYYEIYRKTHRLNGDVLYHHYFTQLEHLVTKSLREYECIHNYKYPYLNGHNYSFIEDFLDSIN
eukprot:gene12246-16418_t